MHFKTMGMYEVSDGDNILLRENRAVQRIFESDYFSWGPGKC